ncbi:NAD-dependent deacylase [Marivibrio halodurans]|uniref:NAD-dependent protein deacylase n=1 Tax=Marivibrio halodurans TaxID=2039722 RepID=A0A8J7S127_9PROT|nr:NAD-dependent deacylase [Marivibrio halodurans]MBP5857950.1 NAD-dependent deacylase [Marivibrio halodurans]
MATDLDRLGLARVDGPIVILTGAGISKESGIDTFRDKGGLWSRVSIEEVATPQAFARDPARVHDFYNTRRRDLQRREIRPNPAHHAIARLERIWPHPVLTVTQNIDDLHERGGAERLIHMHGELLKARCAHCGDVRGWRDDVTVATECAACGLAGGMRPHVVWFGEMPFAMEEIEAALAEAALFIAIGTSATVYPAAGFVMAAREHGCPLTVEMNREETDGSGFFHHTVEGPAGETVPALVDRLLAARVA